METMPVLTDHCGSWRSSYGCWVSAVRPGGESCVNDTRHLTDEAHMWWRVQGRHSHIISWVHMLNPTYYWTSQGWKLDSNVNEIRRETGPPPDDYTSHRTLSSRTKHRLRFSHVCLPPFLSFYRAHLGCPALFTHGGRLGDDNSSFNISTLDVRGFTYEPRPPLFTHFVRWKASSHVAFSCCPPRG